MRTVKERCPWSVSSIIRALSQPEPRGVGVGGWDISACVRTHTHLHGAPGCEAKPASAQNRYQDLAEPACVFVLYLSVIAAFAVSVCLCLGVYAAGRRLESKLKLSDTSRGCAAWKKSMPA